ncbi:AlpA family transcriptional regulator [Granulosicoccus sp.]|nr:AlpA family transcriptional regulator [Granulosicoccus sp.]MDB4222360.1 AlpA family transcriptional regulator [Granulosicoccus sp.]
MSHRILRLPEVKKLTGLSRSTIYLRMANREFPESISLGGRAVGWLEQDVYEWIVERIEQSRINDHG